MRESNLVCLEGRTYSGGADDGGHPVRELEVLFCLNRGLLSLSPKEIDMSPSPFSPLSTSSSSLKSLGAVVSPPPPTLVFRIHFNYYHSCALAFICSNISS